uniref:glutathione S-transferase C-terminal domain-containing protein n=1 Tax=Myxine glutinosa TaxID=7769 RepID=UPI00358E1AA2
MHQMVRQPPGVLHPGSSLYLCGSKSMGTPTLMVPSSRHCRTRNATRKGIQMAAETSTPMHVYLDFAGVFDGIVLPVESAIVLFLLEYCESQKVEVILVYNEKLCERPSGNIAAECYADAFVKGGQNLPQIPDVFDTSSFPDRNFIANSNMECGHITLWSSTSHLMVRQMSLKDLPEVIAYCRLPAIMESRRGTLCRAGLATVARHLVVLASQESEQHASLRRLLGFRGTCLKACAEVSRWTRLCEVTLPEAVGQLTQPGKLNTVSDIPVDLFELEQLLKEPVRVHNDDKLRRHKLQVACSETAASIQNFIEGDVEELISRFSDLQNGGKTEQTRRKREAPSVRRAARDELPSLRHVFAEGLDFMLADLLLLPSIHLFLVLLKGRLSDICIQLSLLCAWYTRVSNVPGVREAAARSGWSFLTLSPIIIEPDSSIVSAVKTCDPVQSKPRPVSTSKEQLGFKGGPRPTLAKLKKVGIEPLVTSYPCLEYDIPWDTYPIAVDPSEGELSAGRATRKRQQLASVAACVQAIAKPGHVIVDFCSGGGHLGILLAYMLPKCRVLMVENKEASLERAVGRCRQLGLTNVEMFQANLDYFIGPFDIGVAIHACGVATDMVLQRCVSVAAAFVLCPCCYGFVQNTDKIAFPCSDRFRRSLSNKEHMILCRFADQTAVHLPEDRKHIGQSCMSLVDLDRAWAVTEHVDYSVCITRMQPESCSPKNNLILGVPPTWPAPPWRGCSRIADGPFST